MNKFQNFGQDKIHHTWLGVTSIYI